ncbi:MAG: hypothetical protein V1799_14905 [bacterium]
MKKEIIIYSQFSEETWIQFLESKRLQKNYIIALLEIEIDLQFIQTFQIVSLACLIEEYSQAGIPIRFIRNNSLADEYLRYIHFFDYWTQGFDRNAFTRSGKNTTLALWKIDQSRITTYADESQKYFENLFFIGKDLSSLHIALMEVFNNIYDHAQSAIEGFALTQYYPKTQRMNIAICDFGVGIPTKINTIWAKQSRKPMSDQDALRAAFFNRLSTQTTPQNRGFGLSNLLGNIRNIKGDLSVYSNRAMIHFINSNVNYRGLTAYLQGTLVRFSFDPNNLPEIEPAIDNEEYFF